MRFMSEIDIRCFVNIRRNRIRPIEGFTVFGQEFTDFIHYFGALFRNFTVAVGSDIQQIITAATDDYHQFANYCFRGIPVCIRFLISE